ncbi:MAG: hypothetical protein QOE61_4196, partial [Micromonosporaceae bacterium]|nr:hypothetical protein [Micromonosporaceae bacterium]
MSGADEAEASRLRAGPYLSGSGKDPLDSAAVNADTQLLPVIESKPAVVDASGPEAAQATSAATRPTTLPAASPTSPPAPAPAEAPRAVEVPKIERARSESPRVDESKVRAVARRAAAALPTLGADEPRELPVAAKATVERRRRAQGGLSPEESTAEPAPDIADEPEPEPGPVSGPIAAGPIATDSRATDSRATDSRVTGSFATTTDEGAPTPPLMPLLGQPAPTPAKHSMATHAAAEPAKKPDVARPDAAEPDAAEPDAAKPGATRPDSPSAIPPFPPVPEPPMVNRPAALGPPVAQPAVEDAQVDTAIEAIAVAPAPVHSDVDEWAPPQAQPNGATEILEPAAADLVRPGPPLLEADSWSAPLDTDRENDLYQGKRRATIPWGRVVLIVALVAGVGGLFAIPMALKNSSPNRPAVSSGDPIVIGGVGVPGATNGAGELVSAASSPGSSPSGRATKSPAPGGSAVPGTKRSAVPPTSAPAFTATPPPAPFATLTLQAEDATLSGPNWQIDKDPPCTAGTSVVRIGNWPGHDPGILTFKVSIATAGSYVMRIYFAVQGGSRRAEITVNNASVATPDFPTA